MEQYNKKQGLIVQLGLDLRGDLSVPLKELKRVLTPYRVTDEKIINHHRTNLDSSSIRQTFSNGVYCTDKTFSIAYDYNHFKKIDLLKIDTLNHGFNDVYSVPLNYGRPKLGEHFDAQKTTVIHTGDYDIHITLKISYRRGYVDLLVKQVQQVLYAEKHVYFHCVTSRGIKREISKYIAEKLGS